ncbi:Protein phosphatase 1F [Liparis tanakae]|uniref:Protein phosphatase 1F n=1 Tax=Liparis tanakae TaxID=230148 RepID=A0A4Z2FR60_9TELE|nr:Protein phosphatase 1F [Liparis tanakae]
MYTHTLTHMYTHTGGSTAGSSSSAGPLRAHGSSMQGEEEEEEEEEARSFLGRFVDEFPSALEDGAPLPAGALSRRVTLQELPGESLEQGLRLLADRGAPAGLGALLCRAALAGLLRRDLSPLHCAQEAGDREEEEPPVVLLQAEPVQRLFLNELIQVALARHRAPPPRRPSPPRFLHCSVHAIKNTRRKMEDKHVALTEFGQLFGIQGAGCCAYFAVFDGHGGVDAASYAAAHLHVALSEQETLQSDPEAAFKTAFRLTDDMFRGKAKRERLRSGSTGVAVLLQGPQLTVAWLGDSQAVLVRGGLAVTLMDPHKPDREVRRPAAGGSPPTHGRVESHDLSSTNQDEKQRIEDLGGCVTFVGCWRVNGTYAVSRALGDFDQKPYVSGEADCSTTRLSGDEDYVLLACDGFFDAVDPSEVPRLVLDALRQPADPEGDAPPDQSQDAVGLRVARRLVSHAKAAGSSDNITVMLVFLRPPPQLLAGAAREEQ